MANTATQEQQEPAGRRGVADRTAVVTGGGRGIGRAIAEVLVADGARVAIFDIEVPKEPARPDQGANTLFVECDVTDEQSVDAAFSRVESVWGGVDILVNNAGIFALEPLEETSLESWNRMIAVNLTGSFLCSRRALPHMRRQGWGRIICMGSSAGKTGGAKDCAAYGAAKAGVMTLAKAIAGSYAQWGITANALAPALIETDMVAGIADLADQIPVGRLGQPADVAQAVRFLAGEEAGYITGEVMDVNGGFLID